MSGGIIKADKDYTKEVDKAIPDAEQLAKVRESSESEVGWEQS